MIILLTAARCYTESHIFLVVHIVYHCYTVYREQLLRDVNSILKS